MKTKRDIKKVCTGSPTRTTHRMGPHTSL